MRVINIFYRQIINSSTNMTQYLFKVYYELLYNVVKLNKL